MRSNHSAENLNGVYDGKSFAADFDHSHHQTNLEVSKPSRFAERATNVAIGSIILATAWEGANSDIQPEGNVHAMPAIEREHIPEVQNQTPDFVIVDDSEASVSSEAAAMGKEVLAETSEITIDTEVVFNEGDEGVQWLMDQYANNGVEISARDAYDMWLTVGPVLFNESDAMEYVQPGDYADDTAPLEARPKANEDTEHEFYTVNPEAQKILEDDIEQRLDADQSTPEEPIIDVA